MDVETLLSKATDSLTVGRAFGPPIERDGTVIIPVAWVVGGGGGGSGTAEGNESHQNGSGAGFGSFTWPLGVYVVKEGNARWVPVIDATLVGLSVIFLLRAIVRLRVIRRGRLHGASQ